jgi:putative ABC transport system substrate-binding protein
MRRRVLLMGALGFMCATVIGPSEAQTVRRKELGYLSGGGQDTGEYTIEILKASLRDLGWRVNETIEIEERWADGDASRLARLAGELIQLRPDVIAATGASEAKALQAATQDIPVVFLQVADPLYAGLVASISRARSFVCIPAQWMSAINVSISTPRPLGSRPSTAALTRPGARKASEIVMLTWRSLHF